MIAFFTILARFGVPSCGHVGDIFGKNGPGLWDAARFDVVVLYLIEFHFPSFPFLNPNLAPGAVRGPILGRSWADVGPFWVDFWLDLPSTSLPPPFPSTALYPPSTSPSTTPSPLPFTL